MPDEKVMIFIDGSNLFHAIRRNGVRINYKKLQDKLVNGRNLIQSYYFCSVHPRPKQSQMDFLTSLRDIGYEVKAYKLRETVVELEDDPRHLRVLLGAGQDVDPEETVDVGIIIS